MFPKLKKPKTDATMVFNAPLLSMPKTIDTTRAGSALRSYAMCAAHYSTLKHQICLPAHLIRTSSHLFSKTPQNQVLFAVAHSKTGEGILVSIFEDFSVLLWRETKSGSKNFNLIPFVFKLKKQVQPLLEEKGKLTVKTRNGVSDLIFEQGRRKLILAQHAIENIPIGPQCVYAQIIQEAVAWASQDIVSDVRIAGETDVGEGWFIPPAMPFEGLSEDQKKALFDHLDKAARLITQHIGPSCSFWGAVLRTRMRGQNGVLSPVHFEIHAFDSRSRVNKELQDRIERAFIAALKHPTSPVPYSGLVGRDTVWQLKGKKVDKSTTHLLGHLMWKGKFDESTHMSAHELMDANAYFGGAQTLFPVRD